MQLKILASLIFTAASSAGASNSFDSTVMVLAEQDYSRPAEASGVILGDHNGHVWVATNFHVTGYTKASGIRVIHHDVTLMVNRQICRSILDLCLLEIKEPERDPSLRAIHTEMVPARQLRLGQKMISRGRIKGQDLEQTGSLEIGFDYAESQILRSGDINFIMGMSGGGVFDQSGRLIALNSAIINGSERSAYFMLPTDWIQKLLADESSLAKFHDFPNDPDVPYFDPRHTSLRPFFFQATWLEINGQWADLKVMVDSAKRRGFLGTGYFEGQLKARGL